LIQVSSAATELIAADAPRNKHEASPAANAPLFEPHAESNAMVSVFVARREAAQ
jgi:hypothetical protein